MNTLEISNLTKNYHTLCAVDNLTITIPQGSIFGILGPNGSGKTTTLSCITGLISQTSGTFKWFDKQPGELINTQIGAIIEQPNFFPYLTGRQNLELVAKIKENITENEISEVLARVNLAERSNSTFSTYSFGMKNRLAIAATLLGNPQVLILDEPTNGLDPEGIAFIRNLILDEAKKGRTIIIASHILDEVQKICSHVMVLKKGKLIASGKVQDIMGTQQQIAIVSDDNNKLHELLVNSGLLKSIIIKENDLILELAENVNIKEVSKLAVNNNILITKLEEIHRSLEDEFLKMIK